MIAIVILFILNLLPFSIPTTSSITEVCKKNPQLFNMTQESCAGIKAGSLFEECVKNAMPNVRECSNFITT
jgi:hypothetical protein